MRPIASSRVHPVLSTNASLTSRYLSSTKVDRVNGCGLHLNAFANFSSDSERFFWSGRIAVAV